VADLLGFSLARRLLHEVAEVSMDADIDTLTDEHPERHRLRYHVVAAERPQEGHRRMVIVIDFAEEPTRPCRPPSGTP
jgi:hypothetical protein